LAARFLAGRAGFSPAATFRVADKAPPVRNMS
jgi:hypothetical protein